MNGRTVARSVRLALAGFSILVGSVGPVEAGTTGRITGKVLDPAKQPMAGANVAVPAARTGAIAEADGSFSIINVPAGTYDVRVSLLGYQPVLVQGVVVSSDNVTQLDVTLKVAPVQMQEVVVTAERPVVDVNQTSQVASVSRKELSTLPVQDLQDVVNLQAGVVEGHFRGGRLGEVQYQVDGVTVNNPYDNTSSLRLDRSLIEEVQVISGTFDAEYGQAMSGVVNAVLRSGGDHFQWNGEGVHGRLLLRRRTMPDRDPGARWLRGGDAAHRAHAVDPAALQNYQLTVSGPDRTPKTVFLVTGRYYNADDYIHALRRFMPTDTNDFQHKIAYPTGDGARCRSASRTSGRAWRSSTTMSIKNWDLDYQAILNQVQARRSTYAFRFDPEGLSRQHTLLDRPRPRVTRTRSARPRSSTRACVRTTSTIATWPTTISTTRATTRQAAHSGIRATRTVPTSRASTSRASPRPPTRWWRRGSTRARSTG